MNKMVRIITVAVIFAVVSACATTDANQSGASQAPTFNNDTQSSRAVEQVHKMYSF